MNTITLYHRDGYERTFDVGEHARMAGCGQVGAGKDWCSVEPPPLNWERTVPRYKARWAVRSSQFSRHRLEAPWSQHLDRSIWQYCEPGQSIAAGEEVDCKAWPAPGFVALNYSAERVIEFFNSAMRSRMANSPWRNGRIELDDGLSGPLPTVTIKSGAAA